ncbi:MAG TPA: alanine racemase [Candidatus Omnitrophota bacterium]|nr:alanine racemase [Candidatus Omnitrophota bacterium]
MKKTDYLTYCEIDLEAVRHNARQIAKLVQKNRFFLSTRLDAEKKLKGLESILAVIKADAYGHGVEDIARLLDREGVGLFGISNVDEGITLRKLGVKKPILLLESALPVCAGKIVDYDLTSGVCTLELARALDQEAKKRGRKADVHIKIDTGMGRLGVWHTEAFDFIKKVSRLRRLRIMGIFTHFPAADTERGFTRKQIVSLYDLVKKLDRAGLIIPFIHAANSMGLAGYKTHILNLARPGLMLYGLYPDPRLKKDFLLKPAMSVRSHVIFLKRIPKGRSVSYGRTFFTKRDMLIATVPIGYSDGYFRAFSNRAAVVINGARCPVIGRVTMDQIMVDVTPVPGVKLGTSVTVLGRQKRQTVSAEDLARWAGTINYEIVCSLGSRLPRIIKKGNERT